MESPTKLAQLLAPRYRSLKAVAAGSQGQVFRGVDSKRDNAAVALKWVEAKGNRAGLIAEFEHLASLSHPGLTRVLALEEFPAGLCLVSEFVDGVSPRERMAALAIPARTGLLLAIADELAAALGYLHARGLVHGDIKPENVLCPSAGPRHAVLLDLGLARGIGHGDSRGTPAYMAPEALSGYLDAQSDLYSLGVSLIELASGQHVFGQSEDKLFTDILAGRGASPAALLPSWPPALVALLQSMIEVDRGARPSGAAALRSHIARVAEALGESAAVSPTRSPNFARSEFFGRETELQRLVGVVCSHARGEMLERICEIAGPEHSGRSRLIEEALLRAQVEIARGSTAPVEIRRLTIPAAWSAAAPSADEFLRIEAGTGERRAVLVLESFEEAALLGMLACEIPSNLLIVARRSDRALLGPGAIQLEPLSMDAATRLCQSLAWRDVPANWAHRACELARNQPGPLVEIMRAAASLDSEYARSPDALFQDDGLTQSLLARVSRLPREGGRILEVLAVLQDPVSWSDLAEVLEQEVSALAGAVQELVASGLVSLEHGQLSCVSSEYATVLDEHLPQTRRRALHRRVLQLWDARMTLAQRARHLLITGPATEAASTSLEAIETAMDLGELAQALALCRSSSPVMRGQNSSKHAALMAEVALMTGDYGLAEESADKARRSRDPALRHRGMRAQARCAQHRGDSHTATEILRELAAQAPTSGAAHADLAKSLLSQGNLADALHCAQRAQELAHEPAERFAATEVAGLSQLYSGHMSECDAEFSALGDIAEEADEDRLRGRALGLQAMLAQKNTDLEGATALYARAADLSARSGAAHASAVFRLNEATSRQRMAQYSQALACYEAAHTGLLRGGTPFELCAARCNRGNLLVTLGELASARQQAVEAQILADRAREPRIHFFVHLLLGDLCQREHQQQESLEHFQEALDLADAHGLSDRTYAVMRLAEAWALEGKPKATACVAELTSDSEEHRGEVLACRARVALALGTPERQLAADLSAQTSKSLDSGDQDLAWKLAVLAARVWRAIGEYEQAAASTRQARELFDRVQSMCPEAYRAGLSRHPEAEALAGLEDHQPPTGTPSRDDGDPIPLRRLLALSRRLNSEQRIEPLLDEIIDTAVELSRAERGFLLLRDSKGALQFRVARNMGKEQLGGEGELSTSIAERVAATGEVVMTVDAESDQRFGASRSIAALQLRSILAVPFRVKERVVGTLYLDHRFRRSAFDERAVEIVRELADIAAVAIENARLTRDNQRRQREIDELNSRLEDQLERTEAELVQTRSQVPQARPAGGFARIVGSSAPIRDLLAIAERAAGCDLSVVISGESGTGKELLAQAVHNSGSRSRQAFVPINCGAVPDSLLEAELFGYQRGAFTGADRNKRGLFEVADGGTLFLDEIADTSLVMQSKLLRALQEGEIRPLGSENVRHVDIRVICASNKNLSDEVAAGRFREDLFYRLNVLELKIPPLRQRRGDIGELAAHILDASGMGAKVSEGALRVLQSHDWPGNVRELENELARASAMSEGQRIQIAHLSPALTERPLLPMDNPGNQLALKPQVEALERRLVEAAMQQTGNNQSKAAGLLGLSRYGLQKKLLRYGIVGVRPNP